MPAEWSTVTDVTGQRAPRGARPQWVADNQGKHLCECGCGTKIVLQDKHFPRIPRFIHGHNPTLTHSKPKPARFPCECGCGSLAGSGKRFVSGHNRVGAVHSDATKSRMRETKLGPRNPRYGKPATNFRGRIYHPDGYVLIWTPEHPHASNGRVLEHRLVVERHLRDVEPNSPHLVLLGEQLYLRRDVHVHHKNYIKDDNRIENLTPLTAAAHTALHQREIREGLSPLLASRNQSVVT